MGNRVVVYVRRTTGRKKNDSKKTEQIAPLFAVEIIFLLILFYSGVVKC